MTATPPNIPPDSCEAALRRLDDALRTLEELAVEQPAVIGIGDPDAIGSLIARRDDAVREIAELAAVVLPAASREPSLRDRWNALADRAANVRAADEQSISLLRDARSTAAAELARLTESTRALGAYSTGESSGPRLEDREA